MSLPQPIASQEFFATSVWNYDEVSYPTDSPGALVIGLGSVDLSYRLDIDHGGDSTRVEKGLYNVACFHRLADAVGDVWEARTCFNMALFVNRLLDLGSLDWPMWAHRDSSRTEAITARPILTRLQVMEDDRFYRRFWVDHTLLEIQFKYQGLTIDIGYQDSNRVAVRVSGFFGSWAHVPMEDECIVPIWKGGTLQSPVAGCEGQEYDPAEPDEPESDSVPGGWLNNLSPIVYSLWVREFLFRNDATWEREYPAGAPFPRPLTFHRVEGVRGTPQANVTFRPAQAQ